MTHNEYSANDEQTILNDVINDSQEVTLPEIVDESLSEHEILEMRVAEEGHNIYKLSEASFSRFNQMRREILGSILER